MLKDDRIRTMLIDRRTMMRSSLATALEYIASLRVCSQVATLAEALDALDEVEPNVILLALMDEQDLAAIAALRDTPYERSIIALVPADRPSLALRAKQHGVANVLREDLSLEALIAAIENAHVSMEDPRPGVIERVVGVPAPDRLAQTLPAVRPKPGSNHNPQSAKDTADLESRIARLTRREREVISAVVAGLTSAEVIEHLGITSSTFRHHLTSIFRKLEVANRVELTVLAYRYDIAWPQEVLGAQDSRMTPNE